MRIENTGGFDCIDLLNKHIGEILGICTEVSAPEGALYILQGLT
jgi:hypothetical protein